MNQKQPTSWFEQCQAAKRIRQRFGLQAALDYLIGEKFSTFARLIDQDQDYPAELVAFIAELGGVFTDDEIHQYLSKRRGSEARHLRQLLEP